MAGPLAVAAVPCGINALGAMGGGLRGLIAAGAPLLQEESNAAWAMGGGLRGLIAAGAPLLQGESNAAWRWVVVCGA